MKSSLIGNSSSQMIQNLQSSNQQNWHIYTIKISTFKGLWISLIALANYGLTKQVKIYYYLSGDKQINIIICLIVKENQEIVYQFKKWIAQFNILVEQKQTFQKKLAFYTISQFFSRALFMKQESIILSLIESSQRQKQFIFSQMHILKQIQIKGQQLLNQYLVLTLIDWQPSQNYQVKHQILNDPSQNYQVKQQFQNDPFILQKMLIPSSCFIDLIDKDGKALDDESKDYLIILIEKLDPVNIKHVQFWFGLVNDTIQSYIQIKSKTTKDDVANVRQLTAKMQSICVNIENNKLQQSKMVNMQQVPIQKISDIKSGHQLNRWSSNGKLDKFYERCIIKGGNIMCQSLVSSIYDYCDINILRAFWSSHLRHFLTQINKQWAVYKLQYRQPIKKLIQYLQYALQKYNYRIPTENNKMKNYEDAQFFNVLDILCPDMAKIVNIFENKLSILSLKKKIKQRLKNLHHNKDKTSKDNSRLLCLQQRQIIQQCLLQRQNYMNIRKNVIDKLMYSFFKEIQENNPLQNKFPFKCFYIKVPNGANMPLKKYISQLANFQRNSKQWIDIFKLIEANYKILDGKKLLYKNNLDQFQYQRLPNTNCLGCTTFFLSDMNINNESDTNVNIKVFDSVAKFGDYEVRIKQQLCYMLNNHGGLIFFDCVRQCNRIVIKGASITQKDKQMIQNKVNFWIGSIYPNVMITQNINLSFVPVYFNSRHQRATNKGQKNALISYSGHQTLKKPNQLYYNQDQLQGVYVFRIKVTPHDQKLYYFWYNIDKYNCNYFIYEPKSDRKYFPRHLHKLIKRKYNRFAQNSNQNNVLATNSACNPLNHICTQPEGGVKTSKKNTASTNPGSSQLNREIKYKFMSLVFTRHHNMQKVKTKLASKSIRIQYQHKFNDQAPFKLKAAMYTSILYHNDKFQSIFNIIHNNPDFNFDGKPIIIISITNFIKIENQTIFTKEQFYTLCDWVKLQFPLEIMQVFQFLTNGRTEHYIKSQSKTSTVLLYFLLKEYDYRITLKNPLHIDRLNPEEKVKVWKKIYCNHNESPNPNNVTKLSHTDECEDFQIQSQNHQIPNPSYPFLIPYPQKEREDYYAKPNQDTIEFQRFHDQFEKQDYDVYYYKNCFQISK